MKYQTLFSGKNKKNTRISKCCLLKILSRVLSMKHPLRRDIYTKKVNGESQHKLFPEH